MRTGRRILMVLDHPFPPDVRVENEALALVDAGYDVGVLSIGPDDRPTAEAYRGIHVFRDRISLQRRNKMRGLAGSLPFLTWHVSNRVRRLHSRFPFDVLHMHDLYLFGGGLRAGRAMQLPVVGDLHENWVEALKGYAWSSRLPGRLFVNLDKWREIERQWTTSVDRLIVVIEEAEERNRSIGVNPSDIVVVSNSLNIEVFDENPLDEELISKARGWPHLVYVGGFDLHRGLDTVLQSMPLILQHCPRAALTLVGDGRTAGDLKRMSGELGIESSVRFAGWQPDWRMKSYMHTADICLVPHRRTPHTDATIPHKLFQYMYCRKPVIVSDCKPLKRIVEECECGIVFDASNRDSFVEAVRRLGSDRELSGAMGERGHAAVVARYNWRAEARKLVWMYDELLRTDRMGMESGSSG